MKRIIVPLIIDITMLLVIAILGLYTIGETFRNVMPSWMLSAIGIYLILKIIEYEWNKITDVKDREVN